jgi:hypothetical protein
MPTVAFVTQRNIFLLKHSCQLDICICKAEKPEPCLDSVRPTFAFVRQRNPEARTMSGFCQANICTFKAEKTVQCLDSVRTTFAFVREKPGQCLHSVRTFAFVITKASKIIRLCMPTFAFVRQRNIFLLKHS